LCEKQPTKHTRFRIGRRRLIELRVQALQLFWWFIFARCLIALGRAFLLFKHKLHERKFATDLLSGFVYLAVLFAVVRLVFELPVTGLIATSGVVAIVLSWTAIRAISVYPQIDAVRRPAIMMLSLMVAQLCLGFVAFITRVMWGRDAAQPELPMIISTVVHVAVGALLLATTVILAIQVWRHVPVSFAERVPGREQKPVAA